MYVGLVQITEICGKKQLLKQCQSLIIITEGDVIVIDEILAKATSLLQWHRLGSHYLLIWLSYEDVETQENKGIFNHDVHRVKYNVRKVSNFFLQNKKDYQNEGILDHMMFIKFNVLKVFFISLQSNKGYQTKTFEVPDDTEFHEFFFE